MNNNEGEKQVAAEVTVGELLGVNSHDEMVAALVVKAVEFKELSDADADFDKAVDLIEWIHVASGILVQSAQLVYVAEAKGEL